MNVLGAEYCFIKEVADGRNRFGLGSLFSSESILAFDSL